MVMLEMMPVRKRSIEFCEVNRIGMRLPKSATARFAVAACALLALISPSPTFAQVTDAQETTAQPKQGLRLERDGTEQVYFSCQGKPLLSFGTMSDFIFYAGEDAFDYKRWADWQASHGMLLR